MLRFSSFVTSVALSKPPENCYNNQMLSWLQNLAQSINTPKTFAVLLGIAVLAALDLTAKYKHKHYHYVFGCLLGTVLSAAYLHFVPMMFTGPLVGNSFAIALGVVLVAVSWRLLFGPWETHVKATVLGTFVSWLALNMILNRTGTDRLTLLIAMAFALVPAIFWCILFLPYHREKLSRVFLMFFAGMAATAPILFYDALVRSGAQLHFFYFRIVPESFNSATQAFVLSQSHGARSLPAVLSALALSFVFVALIEEGSKYWVLRKSGAKIFSSIDDAMELSIVVAIGFAFAENILNTSYFPSFVKRYLMDSSTRDWIAFVGNVAGRSVLTSMVHIASTGILGYFVGRCVFAPFFLTAKGRTYPFTDVLSKILDLPRIAVFRTVSVVSGLTFAVSSHAFANFLVSVPDALPSHPRTLGDLLGSATGSPFYSVSLVVIPSLLYVVGGFLLLTWLLEWNANREERGMLMERDMFEAAAE